MKFGQLVEYKKRNIFLEKSYVKCGGITSPKPFSKILNMSMFLNQQSEVLYIVCLSRGLPTYIKTKVLTSGFCLI